MDPELLSLDDLPQQARDLIANNEQEISQVRDRAGRQVQDIRARAERAVAEIQSAADLQIRELQLNLLRQLRPLQEEQMRQGKLDEALAIRDRIRGLKASLMQALADPGNLSEYVDRPSGTSLLFEVIGSTDGIVWGTDIYTSDSNLSSAAVHAGVLQDGERGLVRVTMLDALNMTFTGSVRNGVWSNDYGPWHGAYRVERV